MKNDGLLDRCHLKGEEGDTVHALLCGIGHNVRLLLSFIREWLCLREVLVLSRIFMHYISQFGDLERSAVAHQSSPAEHALKSCRLN